MNAFSRPLVALPMAVLLLCSCGKKDAQIAEEREAALPPEEQVTPPRIVDESGAPGSGEAPLVPEAASVPPAPGSDPTAASVPLPMDRGAVSDSAYEAWFAKHRLKLSDPNMLEQDPDGDGANNGDEFLADTDPNDPKARPGVHKAMRLKQYNEVRLPIVLQSVEGQKARIKRLDDPETRSDSVAVGETIRGLPMKVAKVESRQDFDKDGNPVDLSRVTLEDPATKERVVLVKDLPARTAGSTAVLASADGATTVTVKVGETFQWPGEENANYKVIDLRADQVVVQQVETGKMLTIPKL